MRVPVMTARILTPERFFFDGESPADPFIAMRLIGSRSRRVAVATALISGVFTAVAAAAAGFLFPWQAAAGVSVPVYIISALSIHSYLKIRGFPLSLNYGDIDRKSFFHTLKERILDLSEADGLWHVSSVSANPDPGSSGGAPELYRRGAVSVRLETPDFIIANTGIPCVKSGGMALYFFPDFLLTRSGARYRAVPYALLGILYQEKPYVERGGLPRDADVIGRVWLHPTKSGAPDRRYKINRKIPVALYGELIISADPGMEFRFQMSLRKCARSLSSHLGAMARSYEERRYTREKEKAGGRASGRDRSAGAGDEREARYWHERNRARRFGGDKNRSGKRTEGGDRGDERSGGSLHRGVIGRGDAFRILGLPESASASDITRAYRSLVKKYHPDKLSAGSDSEKHHAGERIREINRAYDELKRRR